MSASSGRLVPLSELMRSTPVSDTKTPEAHKPRGWKTHMERRDGETVAEWNARLSRTCYRCGREFESSGPELDAHEETHG